MIISLLSNAKFTLLAGIIFGLYALENLDKV